ncbi:T-cell receptor beta chain ANA 11, variant [Salpingoeca rosetta]|uniref:T-cell receptor beta chain ANA 11, variant n=1 Tax=Salpingoeca rosetta (strain ATCC 50818 / BSB-021) TaxID=946362 RepID=F2U0J4_SALR5|nr:T-cell receptor beta chain ANA 11, variant [Salpingoeca rosetta]EGD80921.1 T-cell receptor beta chain ANA 11, variant [Salpingoeca rosetta]|eukprot:XP_004997482.1 T-cell receptor beta chain ANA 11, variant [Salpingoeca rosetta]
MSTTGNMRPERGLAVFAQKAQTSPVKPGAKKEQTSATQEGRPATGRRPLPRGLVREVFCVRAGDKEQEKELAKHMKMHYEPWVIRPDPLTDEPRLYLEPLPKFKDVSLFQKKPLLLAKLQQCTLVFDFTKPSTATNRKLKTRALTDICASFDKIEDNVREEGVIPRFIEVFESNCIRRLPPPSTNASGADPDLDEDTHALEPAWAHLELVYTMFIKLMKSPVLTTTHARTFLSRQLLLRLLDMLDCEDPRERARLGVVLHVIYAKAIDCRAFLRTSIYNIFYRYMYETERFNGMSTLLLFMQKVINGFTRPVREEHIHTFQHILLPLLKVRRLNTVFQELTICIISFVDKKPELADVAIKYVLKHWPHTPSLKQLLFLELAHVLVLKMNHGTFKNNVTAIMKRLATCMESYHFQVAERAMFFFDDPRVLTFVSDCSRRCASILLPVLLKVLQQHWCEKVKFIAIQVTRVLQSVDAMAVQKCAHEIEVKQEQASRRLLSERQISTHRGRSQPHVQLFVLLRLSPCERGTAASPGPMATTSRPRSGAGFCKAAERSPHTLHSTGHGGLPRPPNAAQHLGSFHRRRARDLTS